MAEPFTPFTLDELREPSPTFTVDDLRTPTFTVDELRDPENPGYLEGLLVQAAEFVPLGRDLLSGAVASFAGVDLLAANAVMLLDKAADMMPGEPKTFAFRKLEEHLRNRANEIFDEAEALSSGGDLFSPGGAARIVGGLPVGLTTAAAAIATGGPVAGLAGLGALSEADRGKAAAARGAVTGGLIGSLFPAFRGASRTQRAVGLGAGTTGLEAKVGGVSEEDAVASGAVVGALGALTGKPRVRGAKPTEGTKVAEVKTAKGEPEPVGGKDVRVRSEPLIEVTEKTVQKTREFLGKDFSELEPTGKAINLNLDRIQGPNEFKQMQRGLVDIYKGEIQEARRGEMTFRQIEQAADDLGMTVGGFMARQKGQALNAEELLALRKINQSVMSELEATAKRVKSPQGTQADREQLVRLMALAEGTTAQTLGATAEAGRALGALRTVAKTDRQRVGEIRDLIRQFEGATGKELETFADMITKMETPGELSKFVGGARKATIGEKLIEAWINGLLSNPVTHVVNATSNLAVALYTIPETAVAASLGAASRNPNRVRFREVSARVYGITEGARDGLRLVGRILRTGEPSDPNTKLEVMRHRAITGTKGEIIRLPGRFLMAGDEFFKAIGYRQEIKARAMRQALQEGHRGRDLARRLRELEDNPTASMRDASLANARYQTYTNALSTRMSGVQQVASFPAVKLIIPFVRTPTNIMKFGLERTPLGLLSKDVRAKIRAGGPEGQTAMARIAFSSGVMAWVASEAASGNITGSGPSDPELRRAWMLENRPYSIKINGTWHSYSRLEPLGTILGIAADFAEISGHIDEKGADDLAAKIVMSVSRNITSKIFLSGMSALAETFSDPDRYGPRFVNRLAGSIIPAGVAQINRQLGVPGFIPADPILRDARSAIDTIKSRIPGYSQDLPPRRNIWGEPIFIDGGFGPDTISPVYTHSSRNDPSSLEVIRLGVELSKPERKIGGVELEPFEYDRLLKETGQEAKRQIDVLVQRPTWKFIPDGLKKELIEDIYRTSKAVARAGIEGGFSRERITAPILEEAQQLTQ